MYRHWGSVQVVRPIGRVEVYLYSFLTTELEGVRRQRHAPAALYPGKDPVPIILEAGWAPKSVLMFAENLASTGIGSQTVQAVAVRYIRYATRPTNK